jgi:transcriptional regulator with XRE-family HTH domain
MLHIGKNISLLLTRSGKDARWLSGEVDVDESTVSLWISGKRTPTVKNLEKICSALNAEMYEIWYGPQAMPASPKAHALLDIANSMSDERLAALLAIAKTLETQS